MIPTFFYSRQLVSCILVKNKELTLPVNPNGKNPLFIFKMKFKKIENIKEKEIIN